jgi:hypothetical protein
VVTVIITGALHMARRHGHRRQRRTHRDVQEFIGFLWQERAAIAEFDGGLSREEAEQLALDGIGYILATIEAGSERAPVGSGVTSQWLPLPPSCYGDVTLP